MDEIIYLINNNYKKLLNKKYINKKYIDGNQIIHLSIIYNNMNLLNEIINKFGNKIIYNQNNKKENIFHLGCKYKLYKIIYFILKLDIKIIDTIDINGNIGLHYLLSDKIEVLKLFNTFKNQIIKEKINLNKISINYGSILINFICNSKKKMDLDYKLIEIILKFNMDLSIPYNFPPLNLATKLDKEYIIDLILNYNVDINSKDINNLIPIYYAVNNNNINILKKLINLKANLNYYDPMNNIPFLFFVIHKKNINILSFILKYKLNFNIYDKKLNLPINFILQYKFNEKIVKIFLENTNDLNFQNIYGYTPLYFLLKYYDWNNFKLILKDKKLDLFTTNKKNEKIIINFIKKDKKLMKLLIKDYNNNNINSCNKIKTKKECFDKIKLYNKEYQINNIKIKLSKYTKFNSFFIYKYFIYIYIK